MKEELVEAMQPVTLKGKGFFGRERIEILHIDSMSMIMINLQISMLLSSSRLLLCKVPPKTVEACLDWLSN